MSGSPFFITCGVHVARVLALDAVSVITPSLDSLSLLSNIRVVQTGPGLIRPVNPLMDKKTLIVLINAGENLLKA